MRSPRGQLVDIVMHQYWFSPQNSQKEKKRISKAKYTMKTELVNKSTPIKDTVLKKPFFLSGSSYFPCVLCVVWTGWLPEMLTCPKKVRQAKSWHFSKSSFDGKESFTGYYCPPQWEYYLFVGNWLVCNKAGCAIRENWEKLVDYKLSPSIVSSD